MFSVDTVRTRCGFCRVDFLAVKRKQNLPGINHEMYRVRCPVCNTAASIAQERSSIGTADQAAAVGMPSGRRHPTRQAHRPEILETCSLKRASLAGGSPCIALEDPVGRY